MDQWPRFHLEIYPLPGGGHVETYRRDDRLVIGPCASLYLDGVEVMRFDLPESPAGQAHCHWSGLPDKPRLFYPRHWPHDRWVELAASNLVEHAPIAARLAGVEPPARDVLEAAAVWMAERITL